VVTVRFWPLTVKVNFVSIRASISDLLFLQSLRNGGSLRVFGANAAFF
jgi:hypothetical protein